MKDNHEQLIELITKLGDKRLLSEFCRETGYQRQYLTKIKNRFVEKNGYVVKGSKYFNKAIISDIEKFLKKI